MRYKLGRHLGSLSLLGVSISLLGCFDNTPTSSVSAAAPPDGVAETRSTEPDDDPTKTGHGTTQPESVPPKLAEVIKMADAKVADEVLLAYIHREDRDYDLSADEAILLRKHGVADGVIAAMMRKPVVEQVQIPESAAPVASVEIAPPAEPQTPLSSTFAAETVTNEVPPAENVVTQYVATVEAPAPATVAYFNTYLSPHGSWIDVAGYGSCWRPTIVVADPGWKPYCNGGRWVWSDSGWYWQSDYSWGWAAFHYGRWCNDRRAGWVWVPGSVWAPAWVSWRSSRDYCGWAPLPPSACYTTGLGLTYHGRRVSVNFDFGLRSDCYSFVDSRRLDDHAWHRYRLGPRETGIIFAKTKPINRYADGPRGVTHRGIDQEWFGKDRSRHARIPVKLDEVRPNAGYRPDQWRDQGRSLAVFRPNPGDTANRKRDLSSPDRDRTPHLHVNEVATQPTIRQRSEPGWWQNGNRNPAAAVAPINADQHRQPNTAIANPRPTTRPDLPRPQPRFDTHSFVGARNRPKPATDNQPSAEPSAPTPVANEGRLQRRPETAAPPASNPRFQPGAVAGPTTPTPAPIGQRPRFAPNTAQDFGSRAPVASGPAASPRFNRPTTQPTPAPTSPTVRPRNDGGRSPVVTQPRATPSPAQPPTRTPAPTPAPPATHPRFAQPTIPAQPSHPRFQAPATPPPSSTHPRFQQPAKPNQDASNTRGGRNR